MLIFCYVCFSNIALSKDYTEFDVHMSVHREYNQQDVMFS
jgi:hypothetical protein